MRFGVLGPLAVWTDAGTAVTVPEAKVRLLLAVLLLGEGRPVPTSALVERLWRGRPPGNPVNTVQTKVSQLRRALDRAEPGAGALVVRQPPGYLLAVAGSDLDLRRFRGLVAEARAARDPEVRAGRLGEALAVWRGPALADLAAEPAAVAAASVWEEERLVATEEWAEARLRLGDHAGLAVELTPTVARHPIRERLRERHLIALYRAGRQAEALAGYEELRHRLREELGVDPSPPVAALHRAILRQDPALAAPSPPAPAAGTAAPLPTALTTLVGREAAVAELVAVLRQQRLVTLTGPGGVGKTRLAIEVARRLSTQHPDHPPPVHPTSGPPPAAPAEDPDTEAPVTARLVELAGLDAPGPDHGDPVDRVAEAVASALGLRDVLGGASDEPHHPRTGERLAAALHHRDWLLVVDNCERLVAAVADLAALLLARVPSLRVLATSQEPLGLAGERVWPVPPLSLPAPASAPAAEIEVRAGAERSDAVRLLVDRAADTTPGFALTDGNARALAAVATRLDGIPLALELAAARIRALGPEELLRRLDDRFRLLTRGPRDAPDRQRTLRATLDWSWEPLSEPERLLLRRLAVHRDGFDLAAAEDVGPGGTVAREEVVDLLTTLVDRSLVTPVDGGTGLPRYRLLESVAAYGRDRLAEAGELDAVRRRHAAHYLGLAERADDGVRGPEQRRWLHRLDAETANLRHALDTATSCGDVDTALRLVTSLVWSWFLRGRTAEARRSLRAALAVPGADHHPAGETASAWLAGLLDLDGHPVDPGLRPGWARVHPEPAPPAPAGTAPARPDPAHRADGTRRPAPLPPAGPSGEADPAGRAVPAGPPGDADPAGQAAPAVSSEDPATTGSALLARGRALWFLGYVTSTLGDLVAGSQLTDRALTLIEARGDTWGVAAALADRANQRMGRGDFPASHAAATRSRELFRGLGDRWGQLQGAFVLGALAELAGDYPRAERLHQEGLRGAEGLRLWPEVSYQLSWLGRIALLTGDHTRARDLHERARTVALEQDFTPGRLYAETGLALGARREGRWDEAERLLLDLADWHRTTSFEPASTLILAELGFVAEQRGDAVTALRLHDEGLTTARRLVDPRATALALEGLAGGHSLAGNATRAARLLGVATGLRAGIGTPLPAAERLDVDRITTRARGALGPDRFAAEFDAGTSWVAVAGADALRDLDAVLGDSPPGAT
ncbi:AfsR family transcriptional regulator [Actinoalloteichus sp. AHMU CJ021]|uniref:ATPase n=1 Tax=Actinoalloteichus caeruleus DSM 43889 TaxID=1120930 RepID=A0ABT1JDA7_ACTCY|nr:BTAD domain-containing putative transcriptional regulator [Actinoalloteichus caeruleus]AUS80753.1 AfsR family transcriptional regulator [Actinoalloteichus sp. AHMU CJ021]MCP2330151.1 putative ATPase [Actinoalloteichus caeruleus DSM 43889]